MSISTRIATFLRAATIALASGLSLVLSCGTPDVATGLKKSLPPTPVDLAVTAHAVNGPDGVDLVVTAVVRNATRSSATIFTGASCAPFVSLFSNPSGEYQSHLSPAMQCPVGSPSVALAPGDSIALVNRLLARDLAQYSPGTYGIDVAITTGTELTGRSAGNIDLPLRAP